MDGPHFALVLSRRIYNVKTGLAIILVGSSKTMKIPARKPFTLQLPDRLIKTANNPEGKGEIRCDEMRTIDFAERNARYVTEVDNDFVNRAIDLMLAVVDEEDE
jgi:mRNA-degrading endonuclease toxin of MazEF toxin-antitoxin module